MNAQGVGLGLYITKMIVNEFGGEVYLKSKFGNGSTFGLTFQLEEMTEALEMNLRDKNPFVYWSGERIHY